jgi:hypothetical protein
MARKALMPASEVYPMTIETRPAIAPVLARADAPRENDRLMRWFSSAVTALTAAISILVVAVAAVVLGIT